MSTNIKELSIKSVIPLKAFYHLLDKNLISDPLTPEDLHTIKVIEQIWCDVKILQPQLSKMNLVDRERFINSCDYEYRWERYAFTKIYEYSGYHLGSKKLSFNALSQDIERFFGFELTDKHKPLIAKMRKQAKELRRYKNHKEKMKREDEKIIREYIEASAIPPLEKAKNHKNKVGITDLKNKKPRI